MKKVFCYILLGIVSVEAQCSLVGMLSTPAEEGLISGGQTWNPDGEGLTVSWEVNQNGDGTWHYQYTFSNDSGESLSMLVSHFIISVSDNLSEDDVFDFSGDVADVELGTFRAHPNSNPGFPAGQSMYGLKINLDDAHVTAGFDSVRRPMWGDFYAKDGGNPKNYAYNTDFGIAVANLHDYLASPVDAGGNPLFKILVPDTVPEPATLVMLGLGGLCLLRRRIRL